MAPSHVQYELNTDWKSVLPQIFGFFKYLNNLARSIVVVIFIFNFFLSLKVNVTQFLLYIV